MKKITLPIGILAALVCLSLITSCIEDVQPVMPTVPLEVEEIQDKKIDSDSVGNSILPGIVYESGLIDSLSINLTSLEKLKLLRSWVYEQNLNDPDSSGGGICPQCLLDIELLDSLIRSEEKSKSITKQKGN